MVCCNRRDRYFSHCPLCEAIKDTTFRRMALSPSSGGRVRGETSSFGRFRKSEFLSLHHYT